MTVIYQRIKLRRGTAASLNFLNEVLLQGEFCLETDTGKFKIGDGETAWNDLSYFDAALLPYETSSASGLDAVNVQEAIDELAIEKIDDAPEDGSDYVRRDGAWRVSSGGAVAGQQVGFAYSESTTSASTSTTIPTDNTIPQSTEGDAYPSLDTTITPAFSSSLLEVDLNIPYATCSSAGIALRVMIFRDSGPDAVYATFSPIVGNAGQSIGISAKVVTPANAEVATTFKIRWATGAGTGYLMSLSGTQYFGASNKATMTVREIKQ